MLEPLNHIQEPNPGEILVVGCLRNESLRLPDFLTHHRRLGVGKFYLVDNGSTDGSTEYLLQQPDVCLFQTHESYAASRCGIDWLNEVLEKYAVGHWTLILDVDEQFVFPGYEDADLPSFVKWVESEGKDAVCAPMLDMYPRKPLHKLEYAPGDTLVTACAWFDGSGYSKLTVGDNMSVIHRGGPRQRLFWEGRDVNFPSPVLTKFPLVKWRSDLELSASTHVIENVKLAPVTGLLLHFKYLQDFAESVAEEARRGEHFMGARQYTAYNQVVASSDKIHFLFDGTVRYRNSKQLVSLGLMHLPQSYPFKPQPSPEIPNATASDRKNSMIGTWQDFIVRDEKNKDVGGNLRHGDGLTISPSLWTALIDRFAPRTMLDVGAGEGHAAAFFARQGVVSYGIDGMMQNVQRAKYPIAYHDLKSGPFIFPCDLAYCVEVVEHIDEAFLPHLLDTLTNAQIVVMTHALPGQRGHHHVNLQPPEYWIEKFNARGFAPAIDIGKMREVAATDSAENFFAKTGLIFLKRS